MKKTILNLFLLTLLSFGCDNKDDGERPETVTTEKVYAIGNTEAYVDASFYGVKCPANPERGVCYSDTPGPTITNSKESSEGCDGGGNFVLSGLTAKKKYYVRAYCLSTNADGVVYGKELSFTTK